MRVIVADDSTLFRMVMTDVLKKLPGVEVVAQVSNGRQAVEKVKELEPDLLTLDMEMPEMDGLAVLDALQPMRNKLAVIVVSALTLHGGRLTLEALHKGAFDFITKPEAMGAEAGKEALRQELAPRIRSLDLRLGVKKILQVKSAPMASPPTSLTPTPMPLSTPTPAVPTITPPSVPTPQARGQGKGTQGLELIVIGVSTGGPEALATFLGGLPRTLAVPILIVQHMPPVFSTILAENLTNRTSRRVLEANDQMEAEPGNVYIAPGGKQMKVSANALGKKIITITDDPPENNCKPAVDYLFRSVSIHFPGKAMALILTGMGSDGALGLRLLRRNGCTILVQDEASSVVWGMPKAAVEAGVVDEIVPLDDLAKRVVFYIQGGR